jgi:hypothetical protein
MSSRAMNLGIPALLITLVLLVPWTLGLAQGQKGLRVTGTYTNMYYNEEGGDLLGDEIRIVGTSTGYQATLQFAQGVPDALILVDVKVAGDKISFSIPDSSNYPGEFNGTLGNGALRGEFRFKGGGTEKVELRRGKSYWD